MFKFNKNAVPPPLRQSSIDSLVTDTSTSTSISTSDAWVSQHSEPSSHGDVLSPEQRTRPYPGKRSSVFNLRSRSNTAASRTSSIVSLTPPTMIAQGSTSRRSSQDFHHLAGQSFFDHPSAKRSFFRGKKGSRSSGALSPGSPTRDYEEADATSKRASMLRKGKRTGNQAESSFTNLKQRISSPFNFQHLTHANRDQLAALEQTSDDDLVAGFRAVHASHAPHRLHTGMRAENLHFRNFSSESLVSPESRSPSVLGFASPPLSPEPLQVGQHPDNSSTDPYSRSIRLTRSVESFSQPGVTPHAHRHTQSINAPSALSSRMTLAPIDDLPEEPADSQQFVQTRSLPLRQAQFWGKFTPLSPLDIPTMTEDSIYVGHAVTTPDDSAIHPITPPFTPGLDDVAEEPERFNSPRPAPLPPTKTPKSPFFENFSFSKPRSPTSRPISRQNSLTSPKSLNQRGSMTRPMSQMSDTLGCPTLTHRSSIRRKPAVRRKSNTWRVEESWEDDVDYIYEHALEADCELDWGNKSDDGISHDRDRTPEQQDHQRPSSAVSYETQIPLTLSEEDPALRTRFFSGAFRPALLVPSASSVPELDPRSAISASTVDTSGVHTPCEFFNPLSQHRTQFSEAEGFNLSPSLLIPSDFKEQVSRDGMYDDLLADYEGSYRHFPLVEASQSIASSTRNSHVRSSKRSSYDSSLASSGQASGIWSSPVRRSASSSGSLPELVHSRRARRDFHMIVDQLSEQVASFSSFGEDSIIENEEDDATPPGFTAEDKGFFCSEESEQNDIVRTSIEVEVRASLELARRGSTRSTRGPLHYHKYASSDGAAKLLSFATPELMQPPKSRDRAATSSTTVRGNRKPYLSLFPVPPKHIRIPESPSASSPAYSQF
ncbi:hypothetical protein BDV95DRAFT_202960 [Massariosphaeria phaeospora]|uniref:CRIB domain-containing protein n=1 Tax=Massariosphaeria phaeospora TaxID=100035 RepID=A0A7C8HZR0_9PLEO|nr:hypothetical protein BDV95DRAFT_202960 [Massariosphaeria phaeospora]